MKQAILIILFSLSMIGCSQVVVEDYSDNVPRLDPKTFFDGALTAHGVVKDRSGRVIRYFNADIKAYWEGDNGVLEEDFVFDDGEEQRRVWRLTPNGNGGYIGRAGDVVGDGELAFAGNSMFLKYVLRVPFNDSTIDLTIDDRMYLVSPTVMINESSMSKFGINVGSILLVIEKR